MRSDDADARVMIVLICMGGVVLILVIFMLFWGANQTQEARLKCIETGHTMAECRDLIK